MTDCTIRVWTFDNAPAALQSLCSQGGDEDWIVVVPSGYVTELEEYGLPTWLERISVARDPIRIEIAKAIKECGIEAGSVAYVGTHS